MVINIYYNNLVETPLPRLIYFKKRSYQTLLPQSIRCPSSPQSFYRLVCITYLRPFVSLSVEQSFSLSRDYFMLSICLVHLRPFVSLVLLISLPSPEIFVTLFLWICLFLLLEMVFSFFYLPVSLTRDLSSLSFYQLLLFYYKKKLIYIYK